METSLCIELDEKSQLNDKAHLPTEEELKLYLQRVENLEQTLVCPVQNCIISLLRCFAIS